MSSLSYRAPSGSAVVAFRRGTAPPEATTVLRPARWSVYSSSGKAIAWRYYSVTAGSGTIHTITPSGSVVFSGAAVLQRTTVIVPSGGITFSGTADVQRTFVLAPAGQITFSGTVPLIRTSILTPSGSVFFSGTGSIIFLPDGALDSTGPNRISIGVSRAIKLS